jgi:hypothetical protein
MKKIGILTFHRSINYGAYLQAFALSNEIKKRFPDVLVEIIDYVEQAKYLRYQRKLSFKYFPVNIEERFKYSAFQNDLKKLPLTSVSIITNDKSDLLKFILERKYDIIVVGSDAVWAYQKMTLDNPYWLFGDKLQGVFKMSYAASAYSTDFRNVPESDKLFIRKMISRFDYIGVRDTETRNFVQSIVPELNINLNCDPTFLLARSKDFITAENVLRKNFVKEGKPIVTFMTKNLPYIREIKNHIGRKYNYLHINHRDKHTDLFDVKTRMLFNLSPLEWYNLYSKSVLNFSTYFHGIVLGIRNAVPTFGIDKTNFPYPYVGKYEQVMTDLDLRDYFFHYRKLSNLKDEKVRLFEQIDFALANLDSERDRLMLAAEEEKLKAESFFQALETYVLSSKNKDF